MYDLHAHFIPPPVLEWLRRRADRVGARWERRGPEGREFLVVGDRWPFELKPAFYDPHRFLRDQEEAGVLRTLVSPVPQLFLYEAEPELTAEMAALYNRSLAEWAAGADGRLQALATLPLNDPPRAAALLSQAMDLGLRGAIVGPGVGSGLLTDPELAPVWEVADRRAAILFVHPLLGAEPRLRRPMMPNLVGVPWETTVAAADLILSGHLDRYPNVRVLLAHGGGYLPYQIGRLERGYRQWAAVRQAMAMPPGAYLRRLWFDSVLWEPAMLRALVELVGEERVVPGSDYPFDLSARPPLAPGDAGARSLLGG